jgi:hypothetical protein
VSGERFDPAGHLPTRLRYQAENCARIGSPLYGALLRRAAVDAEAGGPTADVLRGHEHDPAESMLALRLMGAVHRRVLEGALPDLAPYYGSGADAEQAWEAFQRALAEDGEAIRQLLDRPVQTNEVGRCAALLPGFLNVAKATGLPLRLLEVGASAGLNLRWDRYRYEADGFSWGDPASPVRLRFRLKGEMPEVAEVAVAERCGCDRSPIDPLSEEGRLTLLSYLWPDQVNRVERVRAALDLAAEVPVEVDQAGAAEWIGRRLAEDREGVATVVFHSIVMLYLSEAERVEFTQQLRAAGRRAGRTAPLAWLRMEAGGEHAEVRLTVWPDGEETLLARAGYHGDLVDLHASGG